MKIMFALTYYRPHWTGLTQYAARLAEGLVGKGHEVSVVCYQHQKELLTKEIINNVRVARVPFWVRLSRTVLSPFFIPVCLKELARTKSDVLVIYLPFQEVLLLTLIAKVVGKKVFLVHNGDLVLPKGLTNRILEFVFYWSTNLAMKLSNGVIVQTEDYVNFSKLLSANKSKLYVALPLFQIPPIDTTGIMKFKNKYNLLDKKIIGFTGRFVEEKGIDVLLRAIPIVKKRIKNAAFVFAGEAKIGYENFWKKIEPLVEKSKNDVILLGLITDSTKLYNFYYSLDLYVQPSRTDCFPSSQIEAVLCGVPSVCTNIPGARWIVKTSGAGILVKKEDPVSMAEGIIKTLSKNFKKELTIAGKLFDDNKVLRRYEEIFGEC